MTDTIQQLHELPDLAAEVFLTWGHPNPTGRPTIHTTRRVHPPAPADLDALDCLRAGRLGLLFRLSECVRAVGEDLHPHPGDLAEQPTWVSESEWLIAHHADWRDDGFLADWVGLEVADINRRLSRAARVQPPIRLECPRCRDPLRLLLDRLRLRPRLCRAAYRAGPRLGVHRRGPRPLRARLCLSGALPRPIAPGRP